MDDQRLGHKRLNEPTGVEQRRRVSMIRGIRAITRHQVRGDPNMIALKYEPHNRICRVIEYRADWADEDNEFGDLADLPRSRFGSLLRANIVGRNRHLRKIVKQIIRQHLDGRHRQIRQPGAGAGDSRAKMSVLSTASASWGSDMVSTWLPRTTFSA